MVYGSGLAEGEGEGEGALEVDLVLGVRAIPARDLRRVPAAARIARHAIGFWLDGDRPVLLIDLPRTLGEATAADPGDPEDSDDPGDSDGNHSSQGKAT